MIGNVIPNAPSASSSAPAPAPSKSSFFNQPSWSNPQEIGTTDTFFHRSNHTYFDIAAEADRTRKKKLAKKQIRAELLSRNGERAGKRRRISDDSDDDSSSSGSELEKAKSVKEDADVDVSTVGLDCAVAPKSLSPKSSPEPLSKQYEDSITACRTEQKSNPYPSEIIDLGDEERNSGTKSDGDDDIRIPQIKAPNLPDEDEFSASDDEFADIAREARERARKKRLERNLASEALHPTSSARDEGFLQQLHKPTTNLPPPDAVVQILITSRIVNTEPLIVCRKLSQRLKDVRAAWCDRQGLTPDFASKVYLTWKGKRLFDVTTCRSLGIVVDTNRDILMNDGKDIMGEDENRQIHMEAMTDEIFEEYQKAKRRSVDDKVEPDEETMVVQEPDMRVKLILRSKGYDDFKLIVKPVIYTCHPFIVRFSTDWLPEHLHI